MTRTQRQIEEHRQGVACFQVFDTEGLPCPGVAVWAEQESHAFAFGCVVPDLSALAEPDRQRCTARLHEVFNRLTSAELLPDPAVNRIEAHQPVPLGHFYHDLEQSAVGGLPVEVHLWGQAVGLGLGADASEPSSRERAAADRVAALYTLCFAHPAVRAIVWHGFWDGEEGVDGGGLLRLDFAPRAAFRYLHKLIGTLWHTRASGETDEAGWFRFRGFFGDYRVAARVGEEPATTGVLSCRGGAENLPLRLLIPTRPGGGR